MILKSPVKFLVLALALTIAISAFAATNSTKLSFSSPSQVAGQQLAAGTYKVTWSGTGENVEVKLAQGSKIVTVKAKLVETPQKNRNYAKGVDQSGNLKTLYIGGTKQALSFE